MVIVTRLVVISFYFMAVWYAQANHSAPILLYHHVSEKTPPSTSISPQKFAEHMAYLRDNHTVVSLQSLLDKVQNRQPLPENAVAITFDDGFRNIMENAHPLLKSLGFPYTIFINPSEVGVGPGHLNWTELQQLSKEDVLIANHYWDHRHMLDNARQTGWLEDTRERIIAAEKALEENIGYSPKYFAYPFGEYNKALAGLIAELGMVGFAQHSGALGYNTNLAEIPRFPAAGFYSNLATLKTKLKTLAMPVTSVSIKDPVFYTPPVLAYSMTLNTQDFNPSLFSCYFRGEQIPITWQGETVSINTEITLRPGRSRVNCTAPSKSLRGRYYWHSQPWFVATKEGTFLD